MMQSEDKLCVVVLFGGMSSEHEVSRVSAGTFVDNLDRARRRYDELKAKGQEASFEDILHNVEERDRIDQTREVSPLRKADDAILLDNSLMSIAEQKEWLKKQFEKAIHASR